jgi:hypothetical protein
MNFYYMHHLNSLMAQSISIVHKIFVVNVELFESAHESKGVKFATDLLSMDVVAALPSFCYIIYIMEGSHIAFMPL